MSIVTPSEIRTLDNSISLAYYEAVSKLIRVQSRATGKVTDFKIHVNSIRAELASKISRPDDDSRYLALIDAETSPFRKVGWKVSGHHNPSCPEADYFVFTCD